MKIQDLIRGLLNVLDGVDTEPATPIEQPINIQSAGDDINRFKQIIDLADIPGDYSNEPNERYAGLDSVTINAGGGLNGPKSTGQTTVPVIANQGDRTGVDDEALRRLREMAGINVQEQEQVMAVEAKEEDLDESAEEELDEAKEMCEVCEATPCKCSESVEESLAKLRGQIGRAHV